MGSEPATTIFLTPKKSFFRLYCLGAFLGLALIACLFLIIQKGSAFDFEQFYLIGISCLLGYGLLTASDMLYEVAFYPNHVRLEYFFLFFFKKRVICKYEDIKVVLCRPRRKLLTFYKKGFSLIGISTAQNKYWQEEQIIQMLQILSNHSVPVKNI